MRLEEMAWLRRKHSFLLGFLVSYMPLARVSGPKLKKNAATDKLARAQPVLIPASAYTPACFAAWTSPRLARVANQFLGAQQCCGID